MKNNIKGYAAALLMLAFAVFVVAFCALAFRGWVGALVLLVLSVVVAALVLYANEVIE